MLEIVDGENDFFRKDNERQADIARAVYDVILQVQMLKMADRKTEKQGEWIDIGGYEVCKNCHEVKRFPHWNFCPSCGADMKGVNNE